MPKIPKPAKGGMDTLNVVTRANFDKVLPQVMSLLEKAVFVTIDTELSGLCGYRSNRYSIFDDLQQRYSKLADSAAGFALLQFGLGIFSFDENKKKCDCSIYSFHLMPSAPANYPERKFCMQVSSIAFLSENKFDFNATFNEGIGYLSRAEEASQLGKIDPEAGGQQREKHGLIELRKQEDQEYIKGIMEKVDEWVSGGSSGRLDLPPGNGYQRLITYQQIELKYQEKLMVNKMSVQSGSPYLSVTAPSSAQRTSIETEEKEKMLDRLRDEVAFRKVIDKIIDLKLPMIGHNCFLDFCHIYDKFIGKLPALLSDFKQEFHSCFPVVLDTKFLANVDAELSAAGSNGLGDIYAYFEDCKENLLHAPGLHALPHHFHDAGFDAYCTGIAFIGLGHKASAGTELNPLTVFAGNSALINKCHVMQSPYEGGLNLAGQDVEPDRSHIFILTGFPDKWRSNVITDSLSKLLGTAEFSVQLSNNCSSEAYISFKSACFKENAMVKAATSNGRLVIEGADCRWQSFESSRSPKVLGKRESEN